MMTESTPVKTLGIVLIIAVGLLNFHIPHFLLEPAKYSGSASFLLESVFLINLIGAATAAVGIYRNQRWGWVLGIAIAVISALLYLAQETVGLPGLPQSWLEPSRIVSLFIEASYAVLAGYQIRQRHGA
jgi:hypothetical protein